jgi:hypothetical protein
MASSLVFVHTRSSISATTNVPSWLSSTLGSTQHLSATQNFIDGPDVHTILTCYNDGKTDDLGTTVAESLSRTTLNAASAPTPLPESPVTTPLALSSSC